MTLWLLMLHHNTKFGNKMFVSLEHIIWTNIDALTLCCDLDLDFSNPFFFSFVLVVFFHRTLWLMMSHTTSSLVAKYSVVQKILSGQTFTDILNHCCDLDLERSNCIFPQDTPAYDTVLSSYVWLRMDKQFITYSRNSHTLLI